MGDRIALGMSGGVDSSVAVAVLQNHGYEVLGVTGVFQRGDAAEKAVCDARAVCERFGIEHVTADWSDRFECAVVAPFVEDYCGGLTPSPCVGCNAQVKIPLLEQVAAERGCAFLATGHYARVNRLGDAGRYAVLAALDHRKDQSYMLCMLSQEQLSRLVLPLGGMTKLEVRSLAAELGLAMADAPESQDICFAPQGYRPLLASRGVLSAGGSIVRCDGTRVGEHTGLADYTIGQRKGIGVAAPEPYYVIGKRVGENELVVGTRGESLIRGVLAGFANWQAMEAPAAPFEAMVKLRYRSDACPCVVEPVGAGRVRVRLAQARPATAPGQYAVFYQGSTVLGGGVIEAVER